MATPRDQLCSPSHRRGRRPRRWGRLLLAASLSIAAVAVGGGPDAVVQADGDTGEGVSARTGIRYWGNFNCIGQRPLFSYTEQTSITAEVELAYIEPGEAEQTVRRETVMFNPAFSDAPRPEVFGFAGINRTYPNGTVFVLRDRLPGQATFQEVLRFGPSDCQDYDAGGQRGRYLPVDPVRILDTRPASRVNHVGGTPSAGSIVDIPAGAQANRPDDVIAVAVTVTMVRPSATGFVQVFPTGLDGPGATSNANVSRPGGLAANLAVSPVGDGGSISVFTSARSDLLVDVVGYFVDSESDAADAAGRLESRSAIRVFDSRPNSAVNSSGAKPGAGSITRIDLTAEDSGLPVTATAAVVNVTATQPSAPGFIQAAAGGTLAPGASSISNLEAGDTKAGLTIVPIADDGSIDVYTLGGAHLIVDLTGWFVGGDGTSGEFVPLQPERMTDTRGNGQTTGTDWSGFFGGGTLRARLPAHSMAGRASALLLNATVIRPGGPGFLQVTSGLADLSTSNVNFVDPDSITANAAIVDVSGFTDRGSLAFGWPFGPASVAIRDARAALDLSGYFTI
ncbi:MAG: hypothetical protein AAF945_05835 [Actinomycetota bacterium]